MVPGNSSQPIPQVNVHGSHNQQLLLRVDPNCPFIPRVHLGYLPWEANTFGLVKMTYLLEVLVPSTWFLTYECIYNWHGGIFLWRVRTSQGSLNLGMYHIFTIRDKMESYWDASTVYVFSLCNLTIIWAVSFSAKAFHLRMPCLTYLTMVLFPYQVNEGVVFYLYNLENSTGMRSMPWYWIIVLFYINSCLCWLVTVAYHQYQYFVWCQWTYWYIKYLWVPLPTH